ncbi:MULTISPECIES: glycosyltransferase [unclassified Synechococcus]|uniref:glycosyltransferase n=1 Tax=unclassified Synechococcus TaxID=2626047 RepID=UPI0008FF6928|nr:MULTISPECIES: glycosyltransferase [unclassified Synechococcus]MCT0245653.1 glycosyltransferase [Synechococcus sp. CS-601]TWB95311.1 glycosyl transferase family 2 [Synechococcus sp. Ace-Pa]
MKISVVIAAHGHAAQLLDSLTSVFSSYRGDMECILVLDGGIDTDLSADLNTIWGDESRLIVVAAQKLGLTKALLAGCDMARGDYIARLDVGDVMASDRLHHQASILDCHPECVLVTSDVEVCGPRWEHLFVKRCQLPMAKPRWVNTGPPEQGLSIDIPHHASVMFRRSAYEAAGGYRPEFYFGQDWDLWYRLAEQGTFIHIPEVLTRVRLFTCGLSSRHWREQRAIAALSRACYAARRSGHPEAPLLVQAARVRPRPPGWRLPSWWPFDRHQAEGAYFIAESLRRNGDPRCRRYFAEAFRHGPWLPKVWLRATQSLHLSAHP